MHPIGGFFGRADTAIPELVKLIEIGQFDLELQRCTAPVTAG